MRYTELKKQYQDKLSELSNKVGLFWAFNREQFNEGMKANPSATGKYTSIGMGGYLPSGNVKDFASGMKTLDNWFKNEKKRVKKEEAIVYELHNHEACYSGDITSALDVLKDLYTEEEVRAVYRSHNCSAQ